MPGDSRLRSLLGGEVIITSDHFVAVCLVLADFDLSTTLSVLLDRREVFHGRPFPPRADCKLLLSSAPDTPPDVPPSFPLRSEAELEVAALGRIALATLGYSIAHVTERECGWFFHYAQGRGYLKEGPPRENVLLRGLLSESPQPSRDEIRDGLLEVYQKDFFSLFR